MQNPSAVRQIIVNRGLDPSKWTVSEDGSNIVPVNTAPTQPAEVATTPDTASQVTPQAVSSPVGTLARSALEAAPSTAASGLGAAGGVALAPAIGASIGLAPESMGISLLGIPLALG